jgi:colanic acid/amylovoran biosynthesis glycosyltransferase
VITEALAQGMPVVSTYHAGIPEVVTDGQSGFLVQERDATGLAEKLERLITDPARRYEMGRRGRKFIEEHYDLEKLNDRLVELYTSPAGEKLPFLSAPVSVSA